MLGTTPRRRSAAATTRPAAIGDQAGQLDQAEDQLPEEGEVIEILAWYSPKTGKYWDAGDPVMSRDPSGTPIEGRGMDPRLHGLGQPPMDPDTKPGYQSLPMQLVRVPISEVEAPIIDPTVLNAVAADKGSVAVRRLKEEHEEYCREWGFKQPAAG